MITQKGWLRSWRNEKPILQASKQLEVRENDGHTVCVKVDIRGSVLTACTLFKKKIKMQVGIC